MKKDIKIMAGNVHFEIIGKNKKNEEEIFIFVKNEIIRLVNIFNFFDEKSSLSKLNKNKKVKNIPELSFLLKESIKIYTLTKFKFNIFLGKEILFRKKNKKLKKINMNSYDVEKLISFDENFIYLNSKDLIIDLGGIAKGFIADELIKITKNKFKSNLKSLLIEARGDIASLSNSIKFPVGILNPFKENENIEILELKNTSLITSGHTKQIFKEGTHIIGDRTEILTITLISNKEKCYFLDALGTYFIQLNYEEVLEEIDFNERFKDIECLIVLENGEFLRSSFLEEYTYG